MAGHTSLERNRRLVAVLLVTRSRPVPNLVFHYPPNPIVDDSENDGLYADTDLDSDSGSENVSIPTPIRPRLANGAERSTIHAPQAANKSNNQAAKNSVLGFSEDSIEKLLSPGCWCDRKKFEVCLDGLTFVGHPMYADQDGSWARRHTHTPAPRKSEDPRVNGSKSTSPRTGGNKAEGQTQLGITITEPKTPVKPVHDFTHVPESLDSHAGLSLATSMNSASTASAVTSDHLMSFHVVFALAASKSRYREVSEMYHHVAKKLSKALHHCQKQSSYIGVESRKLQTLKAKAKQDGTSAATLCSQTLETSEIAWALKEVYEKISIGAIAGIRLNGMEMSLQMPLRVENHDQEQDLDRHSGLLLLEDKDHLVRELAHPDASPLAYFIRELTPTKSLQKQAVKLGIPISDVLYLSQHLIKWKKARAIVPLHPRNTYICGPNAPIDRLDEHLGEYARKFSALPSLPQVLKVLSGRPVKYGMLIPSRDHRGPYMEILAYLVQHNFVQQLKTSGWLQAPTSPKKAVVEASINKNTRPLSVASLLSPQLRPVDDDAASVSSERTAIPVSVADAAKKGTGNTKPADDVAGSSEEVKIIKNPVDPSTEDAVHLEHIRLSIADEELSERLPSLYRCFNGEEAFEEVAAREGLKRSKLETWLDRLQEDGFLVTFRHL